jgi:hypothetical protein
MRTEKVSRRSRRVGYLIIGATVAAISAPVMLCPVQELPRARIGLTGQLDSPVEHPVTLTAQLPGGYGLSASERRRGLPELIERHQAEVVLDGSAFQLRLPAASYCIHRFWWQETPPPPVWVTLRFSDAPGEEYVVWATPRGSFYFVRDAIGAEQSKNWASWRLHLGDYRRDPDAADRVWLLDVRLERLEPRTPSDGEEPSNA